MNSGDESDEDAVNDIKYITPRQHISASPWANLPALVLEKIFQHLRIRYLARCAQVCYPWYHHIYTNDRVWSTFVFKDFVFTRRRFTGQTGWARVPDHWKIRFLLTRTAFKWRTLIFKPVSSLFNLYEFMRIVTSFEEFYEHDNADENDSHAVDHPLQGIRHFELDWQLHVLRRSNEHLDLNDGIMHGGDGRPVVQPLWIIFGTGGRTLAMITRLVTNLHGLTSLALRHLQLETNDAEEFMSTLTAHLGHRLTSLSLVNVTKHPYALTHLACFTTLNKLVLSAQHLNEDVVQLLGGLLNLTTMIILQDDKSTGVRSVSAEAWTVFCEAINSRFGENELQLRIRGYRCEDSLCLQHGAPVTSIVLDTPLNLLSTAFLYEVGVQYATTLKSLTECGYQRRKFGSQSGISFEMALVQMVARCVRLEQLAIRQTISTETCIRLCQTVNQSTTNRPFRLFVKRKAVQLRANWPKEPGSEGMYEVRIKAKCYETTEKICGQLLKLPDWRFLTDNEYRTHFPRYSTSYVIEQSV